MISNFDYYNSGINQKLNIPLLLSLTGHPIERVLAIFKRHLVQREDDAVPSFDRFMRDIFQPRLPFPSADGT